MMVAVALLAAAPHWQAVRGETRHRCSLSPAVAQPPDRIESAGAWRFRSAGSQTARPYDHGLPVGNWQTREELNL